MKKLWMTSSDARVSFHGPADGDVQLVNLAGTFGILNLPHPLFSDDINIHGVGGGVALAKKFARPTRKS